MKRLALLLTLIFLPLVIDAQKQDFRAYAPTPPMGWNSYDCYGLCVNEEQVLQNAQYMSDNLLKYGWEYIVIDGRWFEDNAYPGYSYEAHDTIVVHNEYNIDEFGRLIPAVNKFPSSQNGRGFKPLIDKIHAKGLKFGLHLMRGIPKKSFVDKCPIWGTSHLTADKVAIAKNVCGWSNDNYQLLTKKDGAQQFYNSVFHLFAQWGVDFVKVDDIGYPYNTEEIEMIRKAIDSCGRSIVLSLSPGECPLNKGLHVSSHANMWRIVGDLWDNWGQVKHLLAVSVNWSPYIGNGTWPDCDMIPMGKLAISQHPANGKERQCRLSQTEQVTLFSLMAIAKSPLMFGGTLTQMDDFTKSVITNREVLDVNQHSIGNRVVYADTKKIIWMAESQSSDFYYLALFNMSDDALSFEINLSDYGKKRSKTIENLWNLGIEKLRNGRVKVEIEAHGSLLYKIGCRN